jgi:PA domain-containing protein/RING finger family protein
MRPVRLLLILTTVLFAITLLLVIPRATNSQNVNRSSSPSSSRFGALFSFHSPLFPLSAIISLTDDNSTFFLSRPAAFGPLLPDRGVSGQLWIGRGFGEDPLGRVGVDLMPEGELGCSDVPGWDEGLASHFRSPVGNGVKKEKTENKVKNEPRKDLDDNLDAKTVPTISENDDEHIPPKKIDNDGTDDYLHEPIVSGSNLVPGSLSASSDKHADIQSLQETAEIAGKVVLLSRGGCGFLEKVKWAQKRSAIAVIVGDNIPGGPLITMYAKGDTSNVTIPALFTSYTTAHLLSSLIPSGGHLGTTVPSVTLPGKGKESKPGPEEDFEFSTSPKTAIGDVDANKVDPPEPEPEVEESSWFRTILSCLGLTSKKSNSNTRPPSSGSSDWVVAQDWDKDHPTGSKKHPQGKKGGKADATENTDNFVIGVHDWRNPDLLKKPAKSNGVTGDEKTAKRGKSEERKLHGGLATPESGQYSKPDTSRSSRAAVGKGSRKEHSKSPSLKSWSSKPKEYGASEKSKQNPKADSSKPKVVPEPAKPDVKTKQTPPHDGLWVTLTPTTMSSSPFIDTLLVLVVSPLVTLTLVYALLLIRSRIRRRRWRAPKSVVDRLPIRTYHSIPSGASTSSYATPAPGTPGPTTPLLSSTVISRPSGGLASRSHSRHRPRSFTTSEVLDQVGPSMAQTQQPNDSGDSVSLTESEKREKGLAEWRRRYGGRQRECVVCLEEYVDGVSQVMSLPCGHEFHAECM